MPAEPHLYHSDTMPQLLKRFIEQAPVAIAMFDKKMHYIAVSQRWLDDCHVTFKEVVGRCHYDVVPNIPDRWKEEHQRTLQGVPGSCKEDSFEVSKGEIVWVRWELQPWHKSPGEVGGMIMFVEHITKRKLAEQKVTQLVDQLNSSNEELKRFSYICSHDLKAPIRNLANFSQLLKQHIQKDREVDETTQYYWDVIDENLGRMQGMIQSFLLYAELGEKGLKRTCVNVSALVEGAKSILLSELVETGAQIETKVLPKVFADEQMLAHVFQNLISNAIKFNKSKTPKVTISALLQEESWQFSLKDNGIGIEKKYWGKVFESFSKLHSKAEYPGTGIGLSFSRKIIEEHGGKIWVESSSAQGTTFCFSLPEAPTSTY